MLAVQSVAQLAHTRGDLIKVDAFPTPISLQDVK